MSRSSDYQDEMVDDVLSDEAIEAFLLGLPDPAWGKDEPLAVLATHVTTAIDAAPPPPDHALLQLFWAGAPGAPAGAHAPTPVTEAMPALASRAAPGFAPRRWRRLLAGVAAAMATVTVGVGAAGATGVLPPSAQRVVARVVEVVSPFEMPEPMEQVPNHSSPGGDAAVTEGGGIEAPAAAVQATTTIPTRSGAASVPTGGSQTTPAGPEAAPSAPGPRRAGETPAAGSVPPALPGPATGAPPPAPSGGTPPSTGVDRARETPTGTAVPASPGSPRPGAPARR